jgi:hypothetical protein
VPPTPHISIFADKSDDKRSPIQNYQLTATMVELEQLKTQIDAAGETIKTLKSAGGEVDKVAIGAAVKDLLDLKKQYADNNNGIGVDGKPFEVPMSKAEKKAKEKAEKAAGPAKQVRLFPVCCRSMSVHLQSLPAHGE